MINFGNWKWDIVSNSISLSEEAARILGLNPQGGSLPYGILLQTIHPADRTAFDAFMQKTKTTPTTHNFTHRIVRAVDGAERTVHHRIEAGHVPARFASVNGTIHDITDSRTADRMAARLLHILDFSWNEIYVFNADTLQFMDVNPAARRNLGYSMEELSTFTPRHLLTAYSKDRFNLLIEPLRNSDKKHLTFEAELQRKNGTHYAIEMRLLLSAIENPAVYIAIVQDISERKHYLAELQHKAMHDLLTDLPNRSLFQDRMEQIIRTSRRSAAPAAVLLVDVVRLREVNDLLGHHIGDQVLKETAVRLRSVFRESDTVARLGGDEFAIALPSMSQQHVRNAAKKIQRVFSDPVLADNIPIEIEVSIGIAIYPEHGETPAQLLQHADIAMHIAKDDSAGFCVYNTGQDPFTLNQLVLHSELRQAIHKNELALFFQPKLDIKSGCICGAEALARWPHAQAGFIPPSEFIPMIEHTGLIRSFTLWAIEEAIAQHMRWSAVGIDIPVAVNLSTRNLLDPELPKSIAQLLDKHAMHARHLTLEITESAVMSRPLGAMKTLCQLSEMGLLLSIDDFGTGYSSLTYLKKLPAHALKIDQSFVFGLIDNDDDAIIVRSTIDLAHNLGKKVVAEGVESKEILDMLAILGCDIAQGFYISRPMPGSEFESWLKGAAWSVFPCPVDA